MWSTALILGITGSLHCVGMCSPLVMAATRLRPAVMLSRLLYNGSRILMYAFLGAMVSSFGALFGFPEFQKGLSITIGVICIVMGMIGVQRLHIPLLSPVLYRGASFIKNLFSAAITSRSMLSISFMGMLNGLLPCGLTALALTNCILLPRPQDGFLFMILFGIGTLPVMLGAVSIIQQLTGKFTFNYRRIAQISLITVGILLVYRSFLTVDAHTGSLVSNAGIVICR